MAFDIFEKNRKLIPRWHTYSMAQWLGLLNYIGSASPEVDKSVLDKKLSDWKSNQKIPYAADVIGTAIMLNEYKNEEAVNAAKFILSHGEAGTLAVFLARNFLSYAEQGQDPLPDLILPINERPYWNVISNIKKQIRDYPRNYIKWAELAYFYSTIGQNDKAYKCMEIALKGNSSNRFLLLSGSRFLMHVGEPDKALHYLRKASLQQDDPWIVSAEISISNLYELDPKTYHKGKKILNYSSIAEFHKSELSGSIGTLELGSGQLKKAKDYFKDALIAPTENTLAQAVHVSPQIKLDLREKLLKSVQSYEAEAQIYHSDGNFNKTLDSIQKWLKYQPFSSSPAIYGSFIASVALDRFEDAISIAKIGLMSSPNDFMLNNNHAFSLISLDNIVEAKGVIEKIDESKLSQKHLAVFGATKGGMAFRTGDPELGRLLYRKACTDFENQKDLRAKTIATYFWMKEESRLKSEFVDPLLADLKELLKKTKLKEIENKIFPVSKK